MRSPLSWLSSKWSNYKYRFTPWIALNLDREAARLDFDLAKPQELVHHLQGILEALEQYSALRDDLALYDGLHQSNQEQLHGYLGFCISRCPSSLPGAGSGVKLVKGSIGKGSLTCLYPGTVYQPHQPILLQSFGNRFIFRCKDGVHIDGSHTGVSRIIYSSCVGRDQVGLCKVADTSWLTNRPVNPLNVGQFVNNGGREDCNVAYLELDLPSQFPLHLRKFLPNVNFESSAIDGVRPLRLVVLIAVRDIVEGEELLSSYFTILQ